MPSDSSKICIFVRHGESESNVSLTLSTDRDRYPLTDNGRAAAGRAAGQLGLLPRIDRFYTSPILRARQTAEIISGRIGIAPEISNLLVERGFGRYNNARFSSEDEAETVH
ncbi:MAG TPA: histidine phosphatase family protein, partial [Candidatus Saccharimonadales bacterium]|nr:histidine phosphatase family protein [Candidatus Saccharimonadales bacterium]